MRKEAQDRLDAITAKVTELRSDPLTKDRNANSLIRFMIRYTDGPRIQTRDELLAACKVAYGAISFSPKFNNAFDIAWAERHSQHIEEVATLFDVIVTLLLE